MADLDLTREQVAEFLGHLNSIPSGRGFAHGWLVENAPGWHSDELLDALTSAGAIVNGEATAGATLPGQGTMFSLTLTREQVARFRALLHWIPARKGYLSYWLAESAAGWETGELITVLKGAGALVKDTRERRHFSGYVLGDFETVTVWRHPNLHERERPREHGSRFCIFCGAGAWGIRPLDGARSCQGHWTDINVNGDQDRRFDPFTGARLELSLAKELRRLRHAFMWIDQWSQDDGAWRCTVAWDPSPPLGQDVPAAASQDECRWTGQHEDPLEALHEALNQGVPKAARLNQARYDGRYGSDGW